MAGIVWNWARATATMIGIRRQDIVKEELEERAFDLIHARLDLEHFA